ncbi:MAG TPA: MBL fold metallo-hydrolase [Bacteroidales bacterium]|jgi:glyoxylase-like metal-dependent hydrolase (beta-lactamase superfamily II)|nr:MBL fold metallo-hydrolase [Bacteroidales bacterium]
MEVYRIVFSPIEVNTYVLAGESGECAIIDCGCYDDREFAKLQDLLMEKKLQPVLLLNTHCHLDHIFGNHYILEKYNLRTYSHQLEELNRHLAVSHAELFGLKMDEPPEPAGFLSDEQEVTFGNTKLKSIFVPGHTAGSLAYYSEKDGCVFTGDALFQGSVGRSDLPGGNHETLLRSIKNKLFTLPPSTIVYAGHGDTTDIQTEMRYNPYFS